MPEHKPSSKEPDGAGRSDALVSDDATAAPVNGPVSYRRRATVVALGVAAVLGAFLMMMGVVTTGAAVYTSRSQFCISCHIMEPYYVSWQESSHQGCGLHQMPFSTRGGGEGARQDARPCPVAEVRHRQPLDHG